MNEVNYVIECLPNGEFYAYLLDYNQCCAYGETENEAAEKEEAVAENEAAEKEEIVAENEAIENLQEISHDFFNEISSVFTLEDMA